MAKTYDLNVINLTDRNTGKEINPCATAKELLGTAVELASEVRERKPNKNTIGIDAFSNTTWPTDPELRDCLVNMENVMAYYCINSGGKNKSAIGRASMLQSEAYYDSIIRMIKERIWKYLGQSLAIRCFDGKIGRGIYFDVNLEQLHSNNELHLYSIKQIVIGKTAKTKSGKKDNQFRFVFSESGECVDYSIIAESMAGQFNDTKAKEILVDIGFLMERFNKNIGLVMANLEKQTLAYKSKNFKDNQADNGERILDRLRSMQMEKNQKEEVLA